MSHVDIVIVAVPCHYYIVDDRLWHVENVSVPLYHSCRVSIGVIKGV